MRAVAEAPAPSPSAVMAVGLVGAAGYLAVVFWGMGRLSYDIWGGIVLIPLLAASIIPVVNHIAKRENNPRLAKIIAWAAIIKLLGAIIRYMIVFILYDGVADSTDYIRHGELFYETFRSGDFTVDVDGRLIGTGFTRYLTGLVFAVIGPTAFGGFLFFSWFAFWGLYLFHRAVRIGFPEADHPRYALLIFFLPSMVFWPASIGKESWMMLTLGLSAYGAARVLARRNGGYPLLALGLLGTTMIRPHMSALIVAGFTAAYLVRSARGKSLGPVARVVGTLVVLAGFVASFQYTARYFEVGEEEPLAATETVFDEVAARTTGPGDDGSVYEPVSPTSPTEIPLAVFTVLFRPLPHEADNAQALLAAVEGLALMGLCAWSWRRLRGLPKHAWRNPYVTFAIVYSLGFCVAFASIGTFGILVRQRVQLYPLVFVLLIAPLAAQAAPRLRAHNY